MILGSLRIGASMRPRVFPAEDAVAAVVGVTGCRRFNEAAGIPRGRQGRFTSSPPSSSSFNEAAGIPRGRHGRRNGDR